MKGEGHSGQKMLKMDEKLPVSGFRGLKSNKSYFRGFSQISLLVGQIKSTSPYYFWHDNWLGGGSLVDLLQIPQNIACNLSATVFEFLIEGCWCIPDSFCHAFPEITDQIKGIVPYPKGDNLIWANSAKGKVS